MGMTEEDHRAAALFMHAQLELWHALKEILPAIAAAIPRQYSFDIGPAISAPLAAVFTLNDGATVEVTTEEVCVRKWRPAVELCQPFRQSSRDPMDIGAAITFVNKALR